MPSTNSLASLLDQVAYFLRASPDVEEFVESIVIGDYVSEPTSETHPDCLQEHEAVVTVSVPTIFDRTTVGKLR